MFRQTDGSQKFSGSSLLIVQACRRHPVSAVHNTWLTCWLLGCEEEDWECGYGEVVRDAGLLIRYAADQREPCTISRTSKISLPRRCSVLIGNL
jgi:hypothetical protein